MPVPRTPEAVSGGEGYAFVTPADVAVNRLVAAMFEARKEGGLPGAESMSDEQAFAAADAAKAVCRAVALIGGTEEQAVQSGLAVWGQLDGVAIESSLGAFLSAATLERSDRGE